MKVINLTDAATAYEPDDTKDNVGSATREHLSAIGLDDDSVRLILSHRIVSVAPDMAGYQAVAAE